MLNIPTLEETRERTDNGWIARTQEQLADMIRSAGSGERHVVLDVDIREHSIQDARDVLEPFKALGYITHICTRSHEVRVRW